MNITTTVLAVGLIVVTAEIVLQFSVYLWRRPRQVYRLMNLYSNGHQSMYMADPHSLYRLRSGTYELGRITINPWGFRDSIMPQMVKQKGELRLLVIGGSTTFDINCSDHEAWPRVLERLLRANSHRRIHVINGGVGGYTTAESIAALALRGLEYHPDIVLIHHGYNDVNAVEVNGGFRADYAHYRPRQWRCDNRNGCLRWSVIYNLFKLQTPAYRYFSSLYFMTIRNFNGRDYYAQRHAKQRDQRIQSIGPKVFIRNIRTLTHICRSVGAKPVILTSNICESLAWPSMLHGIHGFNTALRELAVRESIALLDLAKCFPQQQKLYFEDCCMHTTQKGSAIKAKIVFEGLRKWVSLQAAEPLRSHAMVEARHDV